MNQDDFMDLMASQIRANASERNADNLSHGFRTSYYNG